MMKKITITPSTETKLKKILANYKSYDTFSKSRLGAYNYTNLINIAVCPYCNINYTYTVGSGKTAVVRPDIDHFTPQSKGGPPLVWSNLIPACNQCNSRIKHATLFHRNTHLHPYYDDFDSLFVFSIKINITNYMDKNSFDITFIPRRGSNLQDITRGRQNIKDLKLIPRYQYHKDEVIKVFYKRRFLNKYRLQELGSLLKYRDLVKLHYKTEIFNNEINNVSLGKLKRDLYYRYIKSIK